MFDLKNLNEEYIKGINPNEILDIKELSKEDKIKCFRFFLSCDSITNNSIISNIYFLVNGVTTIEDDLLNDKRFFFNSLVEYVDIKLQLKHELELFCTHIIEYYLGIMLGLNIQLDELKFHIPNTYFHLFHIVNVNLLSAIMNRYLKNVDIYNIKPAHCAIDLYNKINNSTSLIAGFLETLIKGVDENVIQK